MTNSKHFARMGFLVLSLLAYSIGSLLFAFPQSIAATTQGDEFSLSLLRVVGASIIIVHGYGCYLIYANARKFAQVLRQLIWVSLFVCVALILSLCLDDVGSHRVMMYCALGLFSCFTVYFLFGKKQLVDQN